MEQVKEQAMAGRRSNGEGSVYKDAAKGCWVGRVTLPNGRRPKVMAPTRREAEAKLAALRQKLAALPAPNSLGTTFGALAEQYRDRHLEVATCAPATKAAKAWALGILTEHIGTVSLANLTTDHIEFALGEAARSGLKHGSLIKVRSVASQVCTYGLKRGMLTSNPVKEADLPAGAKASAARPSRSLDHAQLGRFLRACEGTPLGACWVLMALVGLRPGEALALSWDDLHLHGDEPRIEVRRALKAEDGRLVISSLKTEGSWRAVDLPDYAREALREHRCRQLNEMMAAMPLDRWSDQWPGLVFTTSVGTPWEASNARREFRKVCAAAGLEGAWHPHELRHTAASMMLDANVSADAVANLLGHADLRMLYKHYKHRLRPTVRQGAVVMDRVVAGLF